jgi:hypothetical protein
MGTLTEKPLMVDAAKIREKYLLRKMLLFWIPSGDNTADTFTKVQGDFRALDGLLSGTLNLRLNAWVEHIRERRAEGDDQVLPPVKNSFSKGKFSACRSICTSTFEKQ